VVASASRKHIGQVVAQAIRVSREIRMLISTLDDLKAQIRKAAINLRGDEERVEIPSNEGTATVTFPKPRIVIREAAVPESLKAILPEPVWSSIFAVKITPGEEAEAIWNEMRGAARTALDRVLDRKASTPAVVLPK
jgi:hypothetical protein